EGADLPAEDLRPCQGEPDTAQSEDGVLLFRRHHLPRQLATAEVVGADDRRMGRRELDQAAVDLDVLLLGRHLRALLDVEELAAVEADAAGAEERHLLDLLGEVYV